MKGDSRKSFENEQRKKDIDGDRGKGGERNGEREDGAESTFSKET